MKILDVIKDTWKEFSDDKCPTYAAAIAYSTVFALPPLLMLLLTIIGVFVDPADFRGRIVNEAGKMLGPDSAKMIGDIILQANRPGKGAMAVVGIIMLIVGATAAFANLQDALNNAWGVKPNPKGGIKSLLTKRIISFGMILIIGFMLLVSFVIGAAVTAMSGVLDNYLGGAGAIISQIVQIVMSIGVTWLLFAMIFKILPDAKIEWKDVWLGAFATAVMFAIGHFAISLYLGHSSSTNAFGAAAALAVLLIWMYYAAMILLMGAEFTQVWIQRHGRTIEPERGAVPIEVAEKEKKMSA